MQRSPRATHDRRSACGRSRRAPGAGRVRRQRHAGRRIEDRPQRRGDRRIVARAVMPIAPWPTAGRNRGVEQARRPIGEAQTLQPGHRQDRRIDLTALELRQAASRHCRAASHIARSGRSRSSCALAPQRRGADARPAAARAGRSRLGETTRRARPRAADSRRSEPLRQKGRQILREWTARSMRRASSALSISLVKSPLPPLRPAARLNQVAAGPDDDGLDRRRLRRHAPSAEPRRDLSRLRQRQRAAARADFKRRRALAAKNQELPIPYNLGLSLTKGMRKGFTAFSHWRHVLQ